MPSPWDYRPDQREGVIWERGYYLLLADEDTREPRYIFSQMKGKNYSRNKNTSKSYWEELTREHDRVRFHSYNSARYAMIEIGRANASNVPIGRYVILVLQTFDNEIVATLPLEVKRTISNEQLATDSGSTNYEHPAVQPVDSPLQTRSQQN